MNSLIKNELIKVFSQKKIYIFLFIIFATIMFLSLVNYLGLIKMTVNGQTFPYASLRLLAEILLPMFSIILIAEIITDERVNGTFKIFLIHPVSREKLFVAKVLALALTLIILMIFSILLSYISGTLLFGWGNGFKIDDSILTSGQGLAVTILSHLFSLLAIMAFNMLIFVLALILSSSGAVVGASTGIFFLMIVITQFIPDFRFLFINSYFGFYEEIMFGISTVKLLAGLAIIFVYLFIGYFTSLSIVKKLDIVS